MMIATKCPTAEQLQAFSLGQLSDPQSDALLDHIRDCEVCKAELETVQDGEDSLIASLRGPDALDGFDAEPNCKVALAKALGALALAGDPILTGELTTGTDLDHLPKTIGEYEIVRPLGRGGMGSVFLARHTKLGREVALKVLAGHRLADPRMRQRFEAEMRAVGTLSHPNIVAAHDAREVDGTAVLVTEYIDGLDLGQLTERTGPLSVADACEIIRQVAVALAYTSGQGFVHRDVKPSNIMLSKRGEVKLLDLGLARLQLADLEQPAGMTGTGQAMGTADYVAPEQVTDSRGVDVRADIYSLGCTLFKLLSGTAPFTGAEHGTAFAKMTAHVSAQPPSLAQRIAEAPAGLVKLVDAMLAKEPAKRPQSPEAVAEKLTRYTKGSDLRQLAERAAALEPRGAGKPLAVTTSPQAKARHEPLLGRTVPMPVAIAAGLIGVLLGFAMGIVITITKPDGSKLTLTVPDGSDIDIRDTVASDQPTTALGVKTTNLVSPLIFAVLAETTEIDVYGLESAKQMLDKSDGKRPVTTDVGIWYPIVPDVDVSIQASHLGQRYTLARNEQNEVIDWDEARGRLSMMVSRGSDARETTIDLGFSEPLSTRIKELTRNNLNRRLAIIVNGRVVSAPKIMSEISSRAQITGTFTEEDIRFLSGALTGLFSEPSKRARPAGIDDAEEAVQQALRSAQQALRSAALQAQTRKRLKRIGIAFHNFQDTFHKFPGSSNHLEGALGIGGKDVQPFSWRVAILPFIGEDTLYQEYRFDEPWDSEHNLTLLAKMPDAYRSPFATGQDADAPTGETHYQGFVGKQTALGSGDGEKIHSFTDGTSNTLLIAESQDTVPWTKPQDLPFEKAEDTRRLKPFDGQPLQYLTADGAVHSMDPVDYEKLANMITRDGRELVTP